MYRSKLFISLLIAVIVSQFLVVAVYATPSQDDTTASWTDTFAGTSGSLSASSQAGINTITGAIELTKNDGSNTFVTPRYLSGTATSVTIAPLIYGHWNQLSFSVTNTANTSIKLQVYLRDGTTLVSDSVLPGNSAGFSTSPVDLSAMPYSTTVGEIRLKATLTTTNTSETPKLNDWTVSWTKNNGVSNDPTSPDGPWPQANRNNRSTNQMDGTLSGAYTLAWANQTMNTPNVITANGDVVTQTYRADATQPVVVATLNKNDGSIKNSIKINDNTTSGEMVDNAFVNQAVDAVTRDNTIYLHQNGPVGDESNTIKVLAIRDGQILWSRHVNQNSGFGGFITIDNSGALLAKLTQGNISKLAVTGEKLWETAAGIWNYSGPVSIGSDNSIYSHGTNANFQILNSSGTVTTSVALLGDSTSNPGSPSVDEDGSIYVVNSKRFTCPFTNGYIQKFTSNGTLAWSLNLPNAAAIGTRGPALDKDYIYIRSACTDEVYIVNKDGGLVKTLGSNASLSATSAYRPLVVDHNQQILHVMDGKKVALQQFDGTVRWNYSFNHANYPDWSMDWRPIGDATEWYAGWGHGIMAFKPWTAALATNAPTLYKPGDTMSIQVASSMLPTDPVTRDANKMQFVMPDGAKSTLTYNSTDTDGTTHWSGSAVMPVGTADGAFAITLEASSAQTQTVTPLHFDVPATGSNNTGLSTTLSYIADSAGPMITANSSQTNQHTVGSSISFPVVVSDQNGLGSVEINGTPVSFNSDGSFTYTTALAFGSNTFTIKATDKAGNSATKDVVITRNQFTYDDGPTKTIVFTGTDGSKVNATEKQVNQSLRYGHGQTKLERAIISTFQQRLKDLGFFTSRKVTGYFGPITRRAVIAFQRALGIKATGLADSRVRASLDSYKPHESDYIRPLAQPKYGFTQSQLAEGGTSKLTETPVFNHQSIQTRFLQQKLYLLGFYIGPMHGWYNSSTRAAVKAYRKAVGLGSGVLDQPTRNALNTL